jgi:hypothetical protein
LNGTLLRRRLIFTATLAAILVGGMSIFLPVIHSQPSLAERLAHGFVLPWIAVPHLGNSDQWWWRVVFLSFLTWAFVFWWLTPLLLDCARIGRSLWKSRSAGGFVFRVCLEILAAGLLALGAWRWLVYEAHGGSYPLRSNAEIFGVKTLEDSFWVRNYTGRAITVRLSIDGSPLFEKDLPATEKIDVGNIHRHNQGPEPIIEVRLPVSVTSRRLTVEETRSYRIRRTFTLSRFSREDGGQFLIWIFPYDISLKFGSMASG